MNQTKLISMAKKLDRFFKVMQKVIAIAMMVAIIIVAVLTVVNMVNPNAVIGRDFDLIEMGGVTLKLAEGYAPGNNEVLIYTWIMLAVGAACAIMIYRGMGYIRNILRPMKEGNPFDREACANFKKLAWTSVVLGIFQNIGAWIETAAAVYKFGLNNISESGMIESVRANFTFDLTFLIVFFVLLLMYYIFSYGAELQQLSDETL